MYVGHLLFSSYAIPGFSEINTDVTGLMNRNETVTRYIVLPTSILTVFSIYIFDIAVVALVCTIHPYGHGILDIHVKNTFWFKLNSTSGVCVLFGHR